MDSVALLVCLFVCFSFEWSLRENICETENFCNIFANENFFFSLLSLSQRKEETLKLCFSFFFFHELFRLSWAPPYCIWVYIQFILIILFSIWKEDLSVLLYYFVLFNCAILLKDLSSRSKVILENRYRWVLKFMPKSLNFLQIFTEIEATKKWKGKFIR